jgi:urease accessory protein
MEAMATADAEKASKKSAARHPGAHKPFKSLTPILKPEAKPAAAKAAPQKARMITVPEEPAGATSATETKPIEAKPIETGSITQPEIVFGEAVVTRAEQQYAVQLDSAVSLDALRMRWGLLVERYGATLATLQPRYVAPRAQGGPYRLLAGPLTTLDLAVFGRIHRAFGAGDTRGAWRWNDFLVASRSTAELQAEDRHLGAALGRVLVTLGIADVERDGGPGKPAAPTFVTMFALATARWKVDARPALEAFAFAWAQAQTSAAVRLVPLGQSAGVRILADAARAIPSLVDRALAIDDDDIGAAAPTQAVLSSGHEVQYSRLFRS